MCVSGVRCQVTLQCRPIAGRHLHRGGGGSDDDLQRHVIRTHELLCSVIDPDAWLAEARARIANDAAQPLRNCALGKELAAIVTGRLSSLETRCDAAIAMVSRMTGFAKYVTFLR